MVYNIQEYLPDFTSEEDVKKSLQKELSQYFGCNYSGLVANGTIAIEVVLKALKLTRGQGVIVPEISFIATATAVANCGLIPVYADVSAGHYGITLESIIQKYKFAKDNGVDIGAVIVVHFAGFVNREIYEIKEFCVQNHIFLIEDCAQAFPCRIRGKRVGTIGDAGTFSFQSSKIINSGEGGLITTNSEKVAQNCEAVLNWGLSFPGLERDCDIPSSNFRLSAIQSYFILKQLKRIDEIVQERLELNQKLLETCRKFKVVPSPPPENKEIFDCPFFFPLKSNKRINTVEPRTEYPMRKSKIVKSILKSFYPDLLGRYLELNQNLDREDINDRILSENDFINFRSLNHCSCEGLIRQYIT
ncbi:MAG: aminotransferase class I/II-fold pyridoxal phosphate-dependent enzyme [Firmicutes bacterium]|nr:aminotransferase class I/II-fold pyridoxal phosphate-dependent enzyme [Bacillota bacterium]